MWTKCKSNYENTVLNVCVLVETDITQQQNHKTFDYTLQSSNMSTHLILCSRSKIIGSLHMCNNFRRNQRFILVTLKILRKFNNIRDCKLQALLFIQL